MRWRYISGNVFVSGVWTKSRNEQNISLNCDSIQDRIYMFQSWMGLLKHSLYHDNVTKMSQTQLIISSDLACMTAWQACWCSSHRLSLMSSWPVWTQLPYALKTTTLLLVNLRLSSQLSNCWKMNETPAALVLVGRRTTRPGDHRVVVM